MKITKGSTPTKTDGGFSDRGINFIKAESASFDGVLDDSKFVFVSERVHEKYKRSQLEEKDILFSMAGAFLGKTGIVETKHLPANTNQALALIRVNNKLANPKFVLYCLQQRRVVYFVNNSISQSAQPNINLQQIGDLDIDFLDRKIQDSVVEILDSVVQRISLNQQTNQTLEQMAQTLFKSWFVDFDPVFDNLLAKANFKLENLASDFPEALLKRAKKRLLALDDKAKTALLSANLASEVKSPEDTSSEEASQTNIHQHFPSEFEFNEQLGWLPKGWEDIAVNEMVKTVSETYPLKTVDKVVFLNTGDILNGKFLHQNYSDSKGLPGQAKKSIKKGDILYSEIRPKNKRFALVNFDGSEHVVSTKLMVLRPNEGFEELFPYFVLTQDSNISLLQRAAESRSGTFPQITYTELAMIRVALPKDRKLMHIFIDTYLKDHFAQKDQRDFQSETLTKLRDTLLPKLISGELQIS